MNWALTLWGWIGAFFAAILGQWRAPSWLRWSFALVGRLLAKLWRTLKARPSLSAIVLAVLAALGFAAQQGYVWWQAQPRPVITSFSSFAPDLTDFINNGKPNVVVVDFNQSVAPLNLVGKVVATGISVKPAVEGAWKWVKDNRLEFTPVAEWPVGTTYEVSLARELVTPQTKLEKYDFTFTTAPFTSKIAKAVFYQDPVNPVLKKVVVDVAFSHAVDPVEFEKRIELRLTGQAEGLWGVGREKTAFTVSYDKLKLNAYIHSAALPIPKESTKLDVLLDKGITALAKGDTAATKEPISKAVAVPGLYGLEVTSITPTVVTNDKFEPEQVLMVSTSQLVHERDLAKNTQAWLLPHQKPGIKKEEQTEEPYDWSNSAEITADVLAKSAKLELLPIAAEREQAELHSFKYKADVGRMIYVQIEPKFKSFGGYLIRRRMQQVLAVPAFPPELRILSQGALLPLSGEKKVAILVRDLPGVRLEIGRVQPAQLQHLVSQTQGNFANPEFISRLGVDNIADRFEKSVPLPNLQPGKAHYEALDLSEYLGVDAQARRGLFLLKVKGYSPKAEEKIKQDAVAKKARETAGLDAPAEGNEEPDSNENDNNNGERSGEGSADPASFEERRLVLVTDLGMIVKQATDGTRDVFVQSIFNGKPVAGATVEVVAKNGSSLFTQTTDAEGRAKFEKLDGLQRERAPLLLLVKKAGDMSFMPLNRSDRTLDVSRFDVGGIQNARVPDQLSAYLFSDRGIYRPGETLRIGMMVKAADWAKSLSGLPLEVEVLDARGLAVKRERIRLGTGGFTELAHTTQDSSPTGNYTVNLYIVKDNKTERQIGSTSVKVQEFMPDRMKAVVRLSNPVADGWISPRELKALVNVQNLFGTPADARRVELTLSLNPAYPAFRTHPGYNFYDPMRAKEGFNEVLPEGKTGTDGDASFDLNLARYAKATYRLSLLAKAFEPEGGRNVTAETSALVSELPYLIGTKVDGELGFVSRGSKRVASLIAIDPATRKIAQGGLTLQLVERKVVSVLLKQSNDTYRYESRKKEALVNEAPLAITAAGHELLLDTKNAGNFSYVVRDAQGVEQNRLDYSVAGSGNVSRSLERNAELQLTLNKKDYAPGEDIEVSIRAPYVGAGLITIERERVFTQQWFKADTTASVQKIKLPKDFEGNGYVSVQFIRDPGSDEIFMSPLSYGVVPFATSLAQRTNALTLTAPELVKPGQVLKMKLKSQLPTRAVVFAVDEGILQVARYQNADPLGFFFQKRALEVKTSQILDLILPEFKRLMAASAPGGDGAGANGRFLNPFKRKGEAPAVYWSGIVDVSGEREFSYTVPDHFNGSLRLMAVAVSDSALGVAVSKTTVRGDFVLSPNLPLMVAPGDVFDVSVGVANNIATAAKDSPVSITLKTSATLEVQGTASQTLNISAMREGVASFKVKVRDSQTASLGSASLEFVSSLGGKSSMRRMDISVRPATPRYTSLQLGSFTGSLEVKTERDIVPEFRKLEASISALPLGIAPSLLAYLEVFPHQCTEQLTSRMFPNLVLAKRPEFTAAGKPVDLSKVFAETLRVLRSRQNAEGGFGLWTASVQADEFASVYAMHMLMEARELELPGVIVPPDLLLSGTGYLQKLAATNPDSMHAARNRAYAIYLLTRNGAVTTPLLAALRETLEAKYPKLWQADTTAMYLAASYQLLKQDKVASDLIATMVKQLDTSPLLFRYSNYYDPIIRDGQTLYLLARHFPARVKSLSPEVLGRFFGNSYNTLSSSYTALALDAMAKALGADALGKLAIVQVSKAGAAVPLELPANLVPRVPFAAGTVRLQLTNEAKLRTYYSVTQSGFDRNPPTSELKQGLEVLREYIGSDGKPATSVRIGDELTVRLSVRAVSGAFGNIALVDLLPGGFEVVVSRAEGGASNTVTGAPLDYADIREDRVLIYTSATPTVQTYSYKVRATNSGDFIVPPAYGESMYEADIQARSLPGRMTVTSAAAKPAATAK